MHTLEQRIKFDNGLTIGRHLVAISHKGATKPMMVDISPRGIVRVLVKPAPEDMYTSWRRVRGDMSEHDGNTIVWGARSTAMMEMFDGTPRCTFAI